MRPNISEFSYGYTITGELIHSQGTPITAAPVFPSLYAEGQTGGGWDLKLERPGIPLFLQFKLSDCMVRSNAHEFQEGWFTVPFYRMHLRPARLSNQHQLLLDLENAGNEVYYSAPAFHEPDELNDAYRTHNVKNRSIWVRPSWIGPVADGEDHHIAFQHPGAKRFCSESYELQAGADFKDFARNIVSVIRKRGEVSLRQDSLSVLVEKISAISGERSDISRNIYESARKDMRSRKPLEQIAYYSAVFLDSQLFIVHERHQG